MIRKCICKKINLGFILLLEGGGEGARDKNYLKSVDVPEVLSQYLLRVCFITYVTYEGK